MLLTRRRCLAGLAACTLPVRAEPPAAPPLMLAGDAPPAIDPAGWLVSEKLDGVRALWDGRRLRFRSGRPIEAPAWFSAGLPALPLDGEVWLARGAFDVVSGLVRRADADDAAWRRVSYQLFDLPGAAGPFAERVAQLRTLVRRAGLPQLQTIEQQTMADAAALGRRLAQVVRDGGEGLMLHRADARWQPGRSSALLKLKPWQDAEAVVIGHEPGQGRHAGRLGALRVRTEDGREFRLGTGFSDAERDAPPPAGATVTYAHRGLTSGGLPRFASFVRVRWPE